MPSVAAAGCSGGLMHDAHADAAVKGVRKEKKKKRCKNKPRLCVQRPASSPRAGKGNYHAAPAQPTQLHQLECTDVEQRFKSRYLHWTSSKSVIVLRQLFDHLPAMPNIAPDPALHGLLLIHQAIAREPQDSVLFKTPRNVWVSNLRLGKGAGGFVTLGWREDAGDQGWLAVKRAVPQSRDREKGFLLAHKAIKEFVRLEDFEDIDRDNNRRETFLYLELCEMTLQDCLDKPCMKPFSDQLLYQISVGVNSLHSEGLVHTGINPSNLFISAAPSGAECPWQAKLGGFGMVSSSPDGMLRIVHAGSYVLQSPEQRELVTWSHQPPPPQPPQPGAASDVYQLGQVFYEVLTGRALTSNARGEPMSMEQSHMLDLLFYIPEYAGWPARDEGLLGARRSCRGVLAHSLVGSMLSKDAAARPSIRAVLAHPFWWDQRGPHKPELLFQRLKEWTQAIKSYKREGDYKWDSRDSDSRHSPDAFKAQRQNRCQLAMPGLVFGAAQDGAAPPGERQWGVPVELMAFVRHGEPLDVKGCAYDTTCYDSLVRFVRNGAEHWHLKERKLRDLEAVLPEIAKPSATHFVRYMLMRYPALLLSAFSYALRVEGDKFAADFVGVADVKPSDLSCFVNSFLQATPFTFLGCKKWKIKLPPPPPPPLSAHSPQPPQPQPQPQPPPPRTP